MLPVEPFREWLQVVVTRYGSVESAEGALGLPARTIRRFVAPKGKYEVTQTLVSLDIVDRAITHEGSSFLWDVYPEWYVGDRGCRQLSFADESYEFDEWLYLYCTPKRVVMMQKRSRRSRHSPCPPVRSAGWAKSNTLSPLIRL